VVFYICQHTLTPIWLEVVTLITGRTLHIKIDTLNGSLCIMDTPKLKLKLMPMSNGKREKIQILMTKQTIIFHQNSTSMSEETNISQDTMDH
jgi:hypothetical protein